MVVGIVNTTVKEEKKQTDSIYEKIKYEMLFIDNPVQGRNPILVNFVGNVELAKSYLLAGFHQFKGMQDTNEDDYEIWGSSRYIEENIRVDCNRVYDEDIMTIFASSDDEQIAREVTKTTTTTSGNSSTNIDYGEWEEDD
jgi:hypothetical protein